TQSTSPYLVPLQVHPPPTHPRFPGRFDNSQPVSRGLCRDDHLRLSSDGPHHVLVVPPTPPIQARILPNVKPAFLIESLRGVYLARSGELTPDPGVLLAMCEVGGGFSRIGYGVCFLGAVAELNCFLSPRLCYERGK